MDKKFSFTGSIIALIFVVYLIIAWIVNLIQFVNCDFQASYKKEIVKGLGMAGLSFVTVWLVNDQK